LQADAANVFDQLYLPGDIVEVGCWVHARRHVYEALGSDPLPASEGLARIGKLFEIEREIKATLDREQLTGDAADQFTLETRQRESVPRLAALKGWLDELLPTLLPKSRLAQACRYIERHWVALNRFTSVGFVALDNNDVERGFCAIGVGRKNWLFAGSDAGGETAAILLSLTQTCRQRKLDPWRYLSDTLMKLPYTSADQLETLLP
jgi:transposase